MKNSFINKVILKDCHSGSQPYKNESGRDAEYRHLSMTSFGKGFTLIELLVVVLIIGILASVALPQYQKIMHRLTGRKIYLLLNGISKAQKVYYMANGHFTDDLSELDLQYTYTDKGGNGWRYEFSNPKIALAISDTHYFPSISFANFTVGREFRGGVDLSTFGLSCSSSNTYGEQVCAGVLESGNKL